jgi:hypothetical protein
VRLVRHFSLASVVAALSLAASALPATAAVTVGQTGNPAGSACGAGFDFVQTSVASGNPYGVPSTGGISSWKVTSWSSFGASSDIQLKLKFFRATATPDKYQAVAHTDPQTVHAGGLTGNTFPTNLTVQAGDILGFHTVTSGDCLVAALSEDRYAGFTGDIADGQAEPFQTSGGSSYRLDVQAQLTPLNTFSAGKTQLNRKKGTATLTFNLPNPGELSGSGQGAQVASTGAVTSKAVPAGTATLLVKAKGKKKRKLSQKGKVKLNLAVTYTPTGGDPSTQSVKVKLKKKL